MSKLTFAIPFNQINANGRVYSKECIEKMIESYNERIKDGSAYGGVINHDGNYPSISDISHKVTQLSIDDNGDISGELEILPTPMGNIIQKIIDNAKYSFKPMFAEEGGLLGVSLVRDDRDLL